MEKETNTGEVDSVVRGLALALALAPLVVKCVGVLAGDQNPQWATNLTHLTALGTLSVLTLGDFLRVRRTALERGPNSKNINIRATLIDGLTLATNLAVMNMTQAF